MLCGLYLMLCIHVCADEAGEEAEAEHSQWRKSSQWQRSQCHTTNIPRLYYFIYLIIIIIPYYLHQEAVLESLC